MEKEVYERSRRRWHLGVFSGIGLIAAVLIALSYVGDAHVVVRGTAFLAGLYFAVVALYQAIRVLRCFGSAPAGEFNGKGAQLVGTLNGLQCAIRLNELRPNDIKMDRTIWGRVVRVDGASVSGKPSFTRVILRSWLPISQIDGAGVILFEAEFPTVFNVLAERAVASDYNPPQQVSR